MPDASDIHISWPIKNHVINHIISEPDNLHPTNGNSAPRSEVFQYTQRTLMYVDYESASVVPGLVTGMPIQSQDKLTYTYILRNDLKWDNGSAVSSGDISFTVKANKCPLTLNHALKSYWTNVRDIIIYPDNPKKFSLVMKETTLHDISFLTSFPVLQRSFHDTADVLSHYTCARMDDSSFIPTPDLTAWAAEFNDDRYGRDPVYLNGLGMYRVTEWEAGQYISLERKKNHWSFSSTDYHEVSYPEKLIFRLNKEESSQFLQFSAQEMDVSVNLPFSVFQKLAIDETLTQKFDAEVMPTYNYTYICFNTKPDGVSRKPLFSDSKTRRAFALLTPVENIIRLQYKEFAPRCRRMVSPVSYLKKEFDGSLLPLPYDPDAAENLFNEAGWTDSDSDGIRDKIIDNKKVTLSAELYYPASSGEWKDMAGLITESAAKAGVKVVPSGLELKLFLEKARNHDFDLLLGSWGGTGLQEDYTQLWHSASWINHGSNYSGFGNSATDSLIDLLKKEPNEEKRIELSRKLQKEIYIAQPYVFLYSTLRRNIVHKRFGNRMLFSEKPGILLNMLRMLSINKGITHETQVSP